MLFQHWGFFFLAIMKPTAHKLKIQVQRQQNLLKPFQK